MRSGWKWRQMRASCPLAGATPTLQDLGRMKDADGMQVEGDAGRMPALPGHNRPEPSRLSAAFRPPLAWSCPSEVITYSFPGATIQSCPQSLINSR
jgi:hypothetical protein